MRMAAALVVVVAMLGGCGARARRNTTFVTGGVIASAGGALLSIALLGAVLPLPKYSGGSCGACNEPGPDETDDSSGLAGIALAGALLGLAGGTVLGVGALQLQADKETERRERNATLLDQQYRAAAAARDREQAWTLTKAAVIAASSGDCLHVENVEPRVRALDAELHRTVFLANSAVAACVGAPVYVPPPPPRDRKEDRERAFKLTRAAIKNARAGHCGDVAAAQAEVRDLDANVYAGWFAPDEAIKRCLQPAETALET